MSGGIRKVNTGCFNSSLTAWASEISRLNLGEFCTEIQLTEVRKISFFRGLVRMTVKQVYHS